VMKEMFEASVDGQAYDIDRWGSYFRPAGMQKPEGTATAPAMAAAASATVQPVEVSAPAPTPVAETVAPAPVATPEEMGATPTAPVQTPASPAGGSGQKAEDILAMIRSRQSSS